MLITLPVDCVLYGTYLSSSCFVPIDVFIGLLPWNLSYSGISLVELSWWRWGSHLFRNKTIPDNKKYLWISNSKLEELQIRVWTATCNLLQISCDPGKRNTNSWKRASAFRVGRPSLFSTSPFFSISPISTRALIPQLLSSFIFIFIFIFALRYVFIADLNFPLFYGSPDNLGGNQGSSYSIWTQTQMGHEKIYR